MGLAPTFVLALTALVLLGIDSVQPESRSNTLLAGVAVLGSLVTLGFSAWYLAGGTGQVGTGGAISLYGNTLVVDGMYLFFTALFASVAAMVTVASWDYLEGEPYVAEFYALVMLAATGMSFMAASNSFVTAFISLELTSLPSYALVAYLKRNKGSVEAGLKYFLIGALSSAIFLFGVSLIYGATGSLQFAHVAKGLSGTSLGIVGVGVFMIAGGVLFKTASVPFHFWAPETYEGAPAPISAFLSSASKAAGFALAFRIFTVAFGLNVVPHGVNWVILFQIVAVVTMTLGNFAAATQENVKRMLAYSSIGQAGYVLIGLAALTQGAGTNGDVMGAAMAQLFVYAFMNTGAFLFIALTEHWGIGRTFEDFNGLGARAPLACTAMTVCLLSLAGIPPFGGFFSKLFLFTSAIKAGFWWLAAVGIINSVFSVWFYFRAIKAMWLTESDTDFEITDRPLGLYTGVVAAALGTFVLLFAFGPVIQTAQAVATALFS